MLPLPSIVIEASYFESCRIISVIAAMTNPTPLLGMCALINFFVNTFRC